MGRGKRCKGRGSRSSKEEGKGGSTRKRRSGQGRSGLRAEEGKNGNEDNDG